VIYTDENGLQYRFSLILGRDTVRISPVARSFISNIENFPNTEKLFEESYTEEVSLDDQRVFSVNWMDRLPRKVICDALLWGLMIRISPTFRKKHENNNN
jgi:hypothetical protein